MGDHGRSGGGGGGKRPANSSAGSQAAAPDPADRPGASGHRFGPGLVCSECGIRWDVHQRNPLPCTLDAPPDPFGRRPVIQVEAAPRRVRIPIPVPIAVHGSDEFSEAEAESETEIEGES